MHASQIRLELSRIVPHEIQCKRRKDDSQPCNCSHDKTVDEIDTMIYHLLKGIR